MGEYKKTVTEITVHLKADNPIFGESVTKVALEDEAGGFFIILSQNEKNELRFDLEELDLVVDAARELITAAERKE